MDNVSGSVKNWMEEKEAGTIVENTSISNEELKKLLYEFTVKNQDINHSINNLHKLSKKKEIYDMLIHIEQTQKILKNISKDLEIQN